MCAKIKIQKFVLEASESFMRKFAPSKISCYTVPMFPDHAQHSFCMSVRQALLVGYELLCGENFISEVEYLLLE